MDLLTQSAIFLALASLAIGLSTLAVNAKNTLFISFSILTILISFWSLFFFLDQVFPEYATFYRLHLMAHVVLVPAALSFMQVLAKHFTPIGKRLFWTSLVISCALFLSLVFKLEERFEWLKALVHLSPTLIALQTMDLLIQSTYGVGLDLNLTESSSGRRDYIYKGALLVLCACVMDHLPFLGRTIPAFGNFALVGYLYFLSQSIRKQRLLNIGALFSRILVLLVLASILTCVYALLVIWIKDSLGLFMVNSFVASFLLLTLLEPLRGIVLSLTKRFLTQKQRELQSRLLAAQQKLTGIVDLLGITNAVHFFLEQTLEPQSGAIFILKSEGTRFRRIKELGKPAKTIPREILANHPLIEYCRQLHRKNLLPIILNQMIENERDRSATRMQRESFVRLLQGLKGLDCNLIIPFIDAQVLGFACLKVESPPDPWRGNWGLLSIIFPYFEYMAQTLQNMEVYVKQREKERLATLGEMAAGLAHEIRNPLGAIKGAAQLLETSDLPITAPQSKLLTVIVDEVNRLNGVVTQFLDYSKTPIVDLTPVDLSKLANKTIQFLTPSLPGHIQLDFHPSKSPATILGNAEQLKQVLINFVQNSIKALESKESATIRVAVTVEFEPETTEVFLSVEDNGCGIRKEHMDKLFIPFFTTSPSGTGLGLPISQKIIEAHRGRIEFYSEPDRFTKFMVILPFYSAQVAKGE
jgi:hypothetical protein